jgi:transcription termination factor Rho
MQGASMKTPDQKENQMSESTTQKVQKNHPELVHSPHSSNASPSNHERQKTQRTKGFHHKNGKGRQQKRSEVQTFEKKDYTQIDLHTISLAELNHYARKLGILGASLLNKETLIKQIRTVEANPDMELQVEGVLEKLPDGFGFLRSAKFDYVSGPDDVYVSPSQIRRFNLKTGDTVTGFIRKPKDGEKYFALLKVSEVNYAPPEQVNDRITFDRLSPLHPDKKMNLEFSPDVISTRIMNIFTPIGKGQRGLIVAPPKVGKTVLLKDITKSILNNYPDSYLMVLLIDERPEEVADMRRIVKGSSAEVISSTFDESAERHVQVAELVLEKAKRLVEAGQDVIILLDSITRLARAYNTVAPASGKILSGGIDANALHRPKRFFGAARNIEEGGSLTIIATVLIDTGSRMDEVIYEEFKGTGNMEMHMTRKLSNRRIYPAFDLLISGTRREDLLQSKEGLKRGWVLQKFLATMNTVEGMEFIIDKMKKHQTNAEFFDSINKKTGGGNS